MCKSGLGSSLGENPAAFAGLDQEEFDIAAANPETNGRNLLAAAQLPQVSQAEKLDGWVLVLRRVHNSRVPDTVCCWLELNLVRPLISVEDGG
jgi:hypothetical protein